MTNNEATEILDRYRAGDMEVAAADPESAIRHHGRVGLLSYPDGMSHLVQLLDCRQVYGRTDLMVTTPYVKTAIWVFIDRVKPIA